MSGQLSTKATMPSGSDGPLAAKRPRGRPPQVQERFLCDRRGNPLAVRLLDGKTLSGALVQYDTYTILLRTPAGDVLVFKQGIAYLAERNAT